MLDIPFKYPSDANVLVRHLTNSTLENVPFLWLGVEIPPDPLLCSTPPQ